MRVLLAAAVALGCSKIGEEGEVEACAADPAPEATIEWIREEVFRSACTLSSTCHNQRAAKGMLMLGCAIDTDGDGDREAVPTTQGQIDLACWNLVGVPADNSAEPGGTVRVVPGDAEASFLVRKLTGVDLVPVPGEEQGNCLMPQSAGCDDQFALDGCVIDAIKQWIDDGAQGCSDPPMPIEEIDWEEYCAADGLP